MRVRSSVELWEADAGWVELAAAPSAVEGALLGRALLADGAAIAFAGGVPIDEAPRAPSAVERLDLAARAWTTFGALASPRYSFTTVALGAGRWLLVGGLEHGPSGLEPSSTVELVDVPRGTVSALAPLPFACAEPIAARQPDGTVCVAGGYADELVPHCARLEPSTGRWRAGPELPSPRSAGTTLVVADRYLVSLGAWASFEPAPLASAYLDLATDRWHALDVAVFRGASLVDLGAGRVLVTGGVETHGAGERPSRAITRLELSPA